MSVQLLIFSDPHTRLLTTVTIFHQELSIFSSFKSHSFTHFLLVTSSFFPLQHLFHHLPPTLLSLLLSQILYHLSYHTPTVNSLLALKKWGKKNRNLILRHLPVLASLETAVSRAAALAQMVVVLSLDMTQSFPLSCYSCLLEAVMFSSHWIDHVCSLSWDLDNIDGIAQNDCSLSKKASKRPSLTHI